MKYWFYITVTLLAFTLVSCSSAGETAQQGDYLLTVNPGEEWLHQYSTFIKNPPQYAIWMEDASGTYLGSLFVTRKIATEGWIFNGENRRVEALPVWSHRRNITDGAGFLVPSKEKPLADGITGATPKREQELLLRPTDKDGSFWLYLEINHSTDFNGSWPEDASPEDENWSGGEGGSGQPSLVYRCFVDPASAGSWSMTLIGHGSPDGSDGGIYPDISSLTTALRILESAEVERLP